ncbi:MAG: methyltransferase domain-containing protein [Vicinamibacteria bacterium]
MSVPTETLLRLAARGLAGLPDLGHLASRGDWRARAAAASALGTLIRDDPDTGRPARFRHRLARRLPGLARRYPSTGPRGTFARSPIENLLSDRSWIVRVAAALALGECRDEALAPLLASRLEDASRPVRLAAWSALAAGSRTRPAPPALDGADPAPERIGDTETSAFWLERFSAAHPTVVAHLRGLPGAPAESAAGPGAWARFLAGEARVPERDSREAEQLRYAQEKDNHYNFTKPFTPGHRDQNIRLLHSFLVVAEHLRVPRGGRVLDLGGGAAWVSELLAKLGYRPFTLDLALPLLRVGRDRFYREHLTARFTAADMTALPFAAGSFDAVVVIDALHHVPDVPAVFREAHRVLAEGGQFLLAEPGEGHAESEKSRAELADHGVCEREIHLPEAVRYGQAAGFTTSRLVPHFVPSLSLDPAELPRMATAPSDSWRLLHEDGRPTAFDEFLLQSFYCHPVLVFAKGERALDSRLPRLLKARIQPEVAREGARVRGRVIVQNEGDTRWIRGDDAPGCVRLGFQLMTPDRRLLQLDFARAVLPHDVAAGTAAEVPVDLTLPDAAAGYVLKLDLVDEQICWFEDVGSRPVYVAV